MKIELRGKRTGVVEEGKENTRCPLHGDEGICKNKMKKKKKAHHKTECERNGGTNILVEA